MARKKLGEILIEEGLIDQRGLRAALAEQQRWGGPLGRVLIELRLLTEASLIDALGRQLNLPTIDVEHLVPPPEVLALVPAEVAVEGMLVPIHREGRFLDLAMADPTNLGRIDEIRLRTQLNIRPHLAGPKAIERAVARLYGRGPGLLSSSYRPTEEPTPVLKTMSGIELGSLPVDEVRALQARITKLEALLARDEDVLRKLLAMLVDKGVATRDEILERLR
jgi:type IV pilus assembly protein PilB